MTIVWSLFSLLSMYFIVACMDVSTTHVTGCISCWIKRLLTYLLTATATTKVYLFLCVVMSMRLWLVCRCSHRE